MSKRLNRDLIEVFSDYSDDIITLWRYFSCERIIS